MENIAAWDLILFIKDIQASLAVLRAIGLLPCVL
jgi:hypothetical protein